MAIWVDADACPRPVKEILFRAASRVKLECILVANQPLYTPKSAWVRSVVVPQGFDVADDYIAAHVGQGDLVITNDIPLAAEVAAKGVVCLRPRGEVINADNARLRLAARDAMEERRLSGELLGGPKAFSDRDKRLFAGALDRWLSRRSVSLGK